jgi:hypothetical protein
MSLRLLVLQERSDLALQGAIPKLAFEMDVPRTDIDEPPYLFPERIVGILGW